MEAERKIVAPEGSMLSNLQQRCVAALVYNWSHMDLQAQGDVMELAKKPSPIVLAEILAVCSVLPRRRRQSLQAICIPNQE